MSGRAYKLEVQTRALQSDLKDLTRKHLEAENKVDHLQTAIRGLKFGRDRSERELSLLQQTCDRALREKNRLQAGFFFLHLLHHPNANVGLCTTQGELAIIRAEKRRLESKVLLMNNSSSLTSKCRLYKSQIQDLEARVHAKEDEVFDLKRAYERCSEEVETLTRALSIKAKELSTSGTSDVHSRLLYAISQGEEESVRLAQRLREVEHECKQLREKPNGIAQWKLEKVQEKNDLLSSEIKMIEIKWKESEKQYSDLKLKYESLEPKLLQQNQESENLKLKLGLKQNESEENSRKIYQLNKALNEAFSAKEQHETENNKLKRSNLEQTSHIRKRNDQIKSLKDLLQRREKLAREQLSHERQKRDEMEKKLEQHRKEEELNSKDLPFLHDKAQELKEANGDLRLQVNSLLKEISAIKDDIKTKEHANAALRKENEKVNGENAALINAKNLLQDTMLDQIDSMRSRLRTQETEIKNNKSMSMDADGTIQETSKVACDVDFLSFYLSSDNELSNDELSL